MLGQNVSLLLKFERLHIGVWGMKFYKQQCYMLKVTHQVKIISRVPISGFIKALHVELKLRVSFLMARRAIRFCARSYRVCI